MNIFERINTQLNTGVHKLKLTFFRDGTIRSKINESQYILNEINKNITYSFHKGNEFPYQIGHKKKSPVLVNNESLDGLYCFSLSSKGNRDKTLFFYTQLGLILFQNGYFISRVINIEFINNYVKYIDKYINYVNCKNLDTFSDNDKIILQEGLNKILKIAEESMKQEKNNSLNQQHKLAIEDIGGYCNPDLGILKINNKGYYYKLGVCKTRDKDLVIHENELTLAERRELNDVLSKAMVYKKRFLLQK